MVTILVELLQYKGILNPDREALVHGLRLFRDSALDVVDCLLLAQAQVSKRRVFSFDKKLMGHIVKTGGRTP